jgi:hypothetical protein
LARWENEGGSLDADWEKRAALIRKKTTFCIVWGRQ